MCAVSNVLDGWNDSFQQRYHSWQDVSRLEFEALRKEVQELRKLIEAAKYFDEATGQPDCESEEKMKLLQEVAKHLGIEM